jgi:histidyl-tRNA synthetase
MSYGPIEWTIADFDIVIQVPNHKINSEPNGNMRRSGNASSVNSNTPPPLPPFLQKNKISVIKAEEEERQSPQDIPSNPSGVGSFDPLIETIMAEAEVIRVAVTTMDSLEDLPPYYVRINHMHLNECIMEICGIEDPQTRDSINHIIAPLERRELWSLITYRLQQEIGLSDETINTLKNFFQIKGTTQVISDLNSFFAQYNGSNRKTTNKATSAIGHLSRLLRVLEDFSVPMSRLYFDTSLVYSKEFITGLNFQIVGVWEIDGKKRLDCLAFGGRYDSLIDYFENNIRNEANDILTDESPYKTISVGLTFSVDKILTRCGTKSDEIPKNLDVFVVSSPSLFSERLHITSRLWLSGIRTDFVRNKATSLLDQQHIASKSSKYIIQLEDNTYYHNGKLKVIDSETHQIIDTVNKEGITSFLCTKFGFGKEREDPISSSSHIPIKTQTNVVVGGGRKELQQRSYYYSRLGLMN